MSDWIPPSATIYELGSVNGGRATFPRVDISKVTHEMRVAYRDHLDTHMDSIIQNAIRQQVAYIQAVEDILIARALAANPWWLHIIARTARWRSLVGVTRLDR